MAFTKVAKELESVTVALDNLQQTVSKTFNTKDKYN